MDYMQQIARDLGVHARWLPPAADAEKVREVVEQGRCYIEHRGHGVAPLLVFEDGGAMELPSVRWMETARGVRLASVGESGSGDRTAHSDVCGSVDSIRAAVDDQERSGEPVDRNTLLRLVDDIESMICRLHRRRSEYERFVENVRGACGRRIRSKDVEPGINGLNAMRKQLGEDGLSTPESRAGFLETAEAVRDVAQYLEYSLSDYREAAVEIHRLYRSIRGARDWSEIEDTEGGEQ